MKINVERSTNCRDPRRLLLWRFPKIGAPKNHSFCRDLDPRRYGDSHDFPHWVSWSQKLLNYKLSIFHFLLSNHQTIYIYITIWLYIYIYTYMTHTWPEHDPRKVTVWTRNELHDLGIGDPNSLMVDISMGFYRSVNWMMSGGYPHDLGSPHILLKDVFDFESKKHIILFPLWKLRDHVQICS